MGPQRLGQRTTLLNPHRAGPRILRPRARSRLPARPSGSASQAVPLARAGASTHVGFVFQFYNLMPMLQRGQRKRGKLPPGFSRICLRPSAKAHALAALTLVWRWADRAKHKPSELSGRSSTTRGDCAGPGGRTPPCWSATSPTPADLDPQSRPTTYCHLLQVLNRGTRQEHRDGPPHDPKAAEFAQPPIAHGQGFVCSRPAARLAQRVAS